MRYNVTIEGVGQSVYFCSISDDEKSKIKNYSDDMDLTQNEVIFNELKEVIGLEWFEICDKESIFGVIPENGSLIVYDEFDKIVFNKKLSEIEKSSGGQDEFEKDVEFEKSNKLSCIEKQKGIFMDAFLNLKEKFDPSKVRVVIDTLTMNDGSKYTTCFGLEYGNKFFSVEQYDTRYHSFESKFIS